MVNLSKESLNKPIREVTPVHIREEEVPHREYTPIHQCAEPVNAPVIEVVPKKQELAAPANRNLSYSQATADCRKQYLASHFQTASDTELEQLRSFASILKKALKRYMLVSVGAISLALLSVGCLLSCIAFGVDDISSEFTLLIGSSFVTTLLSLLMIAGIVMKDNNNVLSYDTLRSVTDVYISPNGANHATISIVENCRQRIDCSVFRPHFCKDNQAYEAVVNDKHDVFVLYSNKTQSAVIIDPKLFE